MTFRMCLAMSLLCLTVMASAHSVQPLTPLAKRIAALHAAAPARLTASPVLNNIANVPRRAAASESHRVSPVDYGGDPTGRTDSLAALQVRERKKRAGCDGKGEEGRRNEAKETWQRTGDTPSVVRNVWRGLFYALYHAAEVAAQRRAVVQLLHFWTQPQKYGHSFSVLMSFGLDP